MAKKKLRPQPETDNYAAFLNSRSQLESGSGFDPVWLPDVLKPFQYHLVDRSIRKGRSALFEDVGLGKTLQQLVVAENCVRHTNRPALIVTPLAVTAQTVREGEKFGIECKQSRDGKYTGKIVVTNYEKLDKFDPGDFCFVAWDESSRIKDAKSRTKKDVAEFSRRIPYRLLCTATPAPNDYIELGTSAEVLGEMGFQDMITKFFKQQYKGDFRGWSRLKYKLRQYAETEFWRWVCSWARAIRRPSDCGFSDEGYILPPLVCREHVVKASKTAPGRLFDIPAENLQEQLEEQRRTIGERCGRVADLVAHNDPVVCWTNLLDESKELRRLIPGCVEVAGSDPDEEKEEKLLAFSTSQIRVLTTRPKVAGFGMNWQHCAHQTFFPSHSYEQWRQCIGRSHRFGQTREVVIDTVVTDGSSGVVENRNRKHAAADVMFSRLVELMNDSLRLDRTTEFTRKTSRPKWLAES